MYALESALKFSMIEINHEVQFKIHILLFPSIANKVSEVLFAILHMEHAFLQMTEIC